MRSTERDRVFDVIISSIGPPIGFASFQLQRDALRLMRGIMRIMQVRTAYIRHRGLP